MYAANLIARFVSGIVLLLLGLSIYLGVRVTALKFEVRELRTSNVELQQAIESCKYDSKKLDDTNVYLRQKMQRLDAYYKQKPKPPVITGDTFNKDNLFMADPK